MKKLVRSRPGWPPCGSATSMRVSPIEMSKWPASSKTVHGGSAGSIGWSFVGRFHSSSLRPANTSASAGEFGFEHPDVVVAPMRPLSSALVNCQ